VNDAQYKLIVDGARRRGATFPTQAAWLDFKAAIDAACGAPLPAPTNLEAALPAQSLSPLSKWQAMIDLPLLKLAFPANTNAELAEWVEPTRQACVRWGIDTLREIASFLANINVESAGLTRLTENLNYSTEALIAKFGRHRISVIDAQRYGRNAQHPANQEMIANLLYGGEWGRKNLGNTEPGDGWKFRGYGPKQITGKANQAAFAKAVGIPVDDVPAYLRTRVGGMMSAGWFWHSHGLDAKAATPGVEDDRRAINGGVFGLAQVEETFDVLVEEMLRRESAA
jgi:putative chitinase